MMDGKGGQKSGFPSHNYCLGFEVSLFDQSWLLKFGLSSLSLLYMFLYSIIKYNRPSKFQIDAPPNAENSWSF